ncbi:hypothetical protein M0812_04462 [Anaeramoeba flamelloides]|uniref:Uncharacterized protein n=1 Tax=Anaeramoeba flamelloides TaxID=1746091 RepID=A0AAV8AIV8_9EUKA|nr:hypothetical protein M0812_04462 [Anaeramoeba flamelloides]
MSKFLEYSLYFYGMNMIKISGEEICNVLKNNFKSNSLNGLILDDCELGSVGIGYVCSSVLLLDNLRKLSISRNLVKDNSIKSNDSQIEEKLNSNNHGKKLPTISPDLESISEMIKILNKNSKNDDHNNNNQNNNNQNNNNQNNLPIKPVIKRRTTFINVKFLRQTENEQSVQNDINSNEGNENILENNMHYEDIFSINKKYENQKTLPRTKKNVDILQENGINQNIKDENKNDTGNNNDTDTENENENENEIFEEEGRVNSDSDDKIGEENY